MSPLSSIARSTVFRRANVRPGGPQDPGHVDSPVLVEAAVLDGDDRLPHERTDRAQLDRGAVLLGGDRAQERIVGRVDERVLADRDPAQVVEGTALVDL